MILKDDPQAYLKKGWNGHEACIEKVRNTYKFGRTPQREEI
jgi:hypothetical protein